MRGMRRWTSDATRALAVAFVSVTLGGACASDLEGEAVPVCSDELGCPAGMRCVGGAYCEHVSDGGAIGRVAVPTGTGAVDVGGGPGVPQDDAGLDALPDGAPAGCLPGQLLCNDVCADVQGDRANCGACGIACAGTQQCQLGVCCDAASTVCGARCVDLTSDPRHCGVCDLACPFGTECVLGTCLEDLPGGL